MWNLVRVDGASWLVDVTNSDTGTITKHFTIKPNCSAPDQLYLRIVVLDILWLWNELSYA